MSTVPWCSLSGAPSTDDYDFKPSPETEVEQGMTLIVMADVEGRTRLEEILG